MKRKMLDISQKSFWLNSDGDMWNDDDIKVKMINYINMGGKIYIGADSMMNCNTCVFAIVIAFHDNEQQIADYYYKSIKIKSDKYKNLKTKILEEVNLAIQAAQLVHRLCPQAKVEVHIDIGIKKINLTRSLYNLVEGWVTGLGYDLKIKPYSWASSSIADWHTK